MLMNLNWFDGAKLVADQNMNLRIKGKIKDYAVYKTTMNAEVNDST
jgi:hypothetical protein